MAIDDLPHAAPSSFDDEPVAMAVAPVDKSTNPRLSILHLMAWTATSAAMLGLMKITGWTSNRSFNFQDGYNIGFCMYSGVVVGGVIMWIARRCRGLPFPTEPGEWLLVEQGAAVLWTLFASLLIEWANLQSEAIFALGAIAFLIIGLIPVIRCRKGRIWRCLFATLTLLFVTPIFFSYPSGFDGLAYFLVSSFWLMLASTIVVAAALVVDIKRKMQRGWAHWVGVSSLLIFTIFHCGLMVAELHLF